MTDISRFHRIQASPGIHEAIAHVKTEIERVSHAKVTVHEYATQGTERMESWDEIYAWTPRSGRLELLEPEKKILADFQSEPISLAAHSTSADFESDVVFIGRGMSPEDYEGRDIQGKMVLTEGKASIVHRLACVERGALGVMTFIPPSGTDDMADIRRYEALWPDAGQAEKTRVGFALTQADGVRIRRWLEEGKRVRVRARVNAELGRGTIQILSALIEGRNPAEEVWLIAHICHPHPGANDNASGSGALLESLRVISRLMQEGHLSPPEYSLRFVWVPEWNGIVKMMQEEPELITRCKRVINVDMVGADPAKSGSVLHLHRTPYSLPSTLNNVVAYWFQTEVERKRDDSLGGTFTPLSFKYVPYIAGSDHFLFTDRLQGIPAVMLNQDPDRFYHTSADTPDKIDAQQMSYVVRALTLSALTLVHPRLAYRDLIIALAHREAVDMMCSVSIRGVEDLSQCKGDPDENYQRYMRWLRYALELGKNTLDGATHEWPLISDQRALLQAAKASLDMIYTSEMVILRRAYEGACAEAGIQAKEDSQVGRELRTFDLEVRRKTSYALAPSYVSRTSDERLQRYLPYMQRDPFYMSKVDELLNLCTDWTPLTDIWDRLCFQFGPVDIKFTSMIVKDLEQLGLIETREV